MTRLSRIARTAIPVVMMALLLSTSACGKKKKMDVGKGHFSADGSAPGETSGMVSSTDTTTGSSSTDGTAGDRHSNSNDVTGGHPENLGGELGAMGEPRPDLPNVYFSLDSDVLDEAATATLTKNAQYLNNHKDLYVILRGHTDDRGTEEYNISLGSRRAQSVRDFLADKSVNTDRLQTVSFGESIKVSEGSDDASRSQNRRVEFFVYTLDKK